MRPIITFNIISNYFYMCTFQVLVGDKDVEFIGGVSHIKINGVTPIGKYTIGSYNKIFSQFKEMS